MQRLLDALDKEWFHIGEWAFSPLMLVRLAFFVLVVFAVSKLVKKGLRRIMTASPHMDATVANAMVSVVYFVVLTVGLLWALSVSGVNVTSLAVFTGAVGVGVGLGLQDLAKNFVAGVTMLATRPVRLGDRVEFGGYGGQVKSIGAYSTVIETPEGASVIVPNSSVLNDKVVNWSHNGGARVVSLTVRLHPSADLGAAADALVSAASSCPGVVVDPPPMAHAEGFFDNGIDMRVSATTVDRSDDPQSLRGDLYRAVLAECRERAVPLAFSTAAPVSPPPQNS